MSLFLVLVHVQKANKVVVSATGKGVDDMVKVASIEKKQMHIMTPLTCGFKEMNTEQKLQLNWWSP